MEKHKYKQSTTSTYQHICRCCMDEGNDPQNINETYKEMLKDNLNLLLSSDSRLSQLICTDCIESLEQIIKFRNMVVETERQLLKLFGINILNNNASNALIEASIDIKEEHSSFREEQTDDFEFNNVDKTFQASDDENDANNEDDSLRTMTIGSTVVTRRKVKPTDPVSEDEKDNILETITIGSTVVTRKMVKRTGPATNEKKSPAPSKRHLEENETESIKKKQKPEPAESLNDFDADSDSNYSDEKDFGAELETSDDEMPITKTNKQLTNKVTSIKKKGWPRKVQSSDETKNDGYMTENKMKDNMRYSQSVNANNSNISTAKRQQKDINVPVPASKIDLNAETSRDANAKIRHNIVLTLQNSTIIPFKTNVFCPDDYKCYYCLKIFKIMNELREHTESQHVGTITNEKLFALIVQRVDRRVFADISVIKCRLCNEQFKTVESLIDHLTIEHEKVYRETGVRDQGIFGFDLSSDEIKCHLCDEKFRYFKSLSQHMNEHFADHVCPHCGKKFATKMRYSIHIRAHYRKLNCDHCDASFVTLSSYRYHLRRRHFTGDVKIKCTRCPEIFANYAMRDKHVSDVHRVHCDICQNGKLYTTGGLYKHINYIHKKIRRKKNPRSINRPFIICEICGYKAAIPSQLKRHMDAHNGVKKVRCEICGKGLCDKTSLRNHMLTHTNDKRFVCDLCGIAFVQKYSLNYHMKSKHKN